MYFKILLIQLINALIWILVIIQPRNVSTFLDMPHARELFTMHINYVHIFTSSFDKISRNSIHKNVVSYVGGIVQINTNAIS